MSDFIKGHQVFTDPTTGEKVIRIKQAEQKRDQGIARADSAANLSWKETARRIVWDLIQKGDPFTSDDVWEKLGDHPDKTHEPRALGAIIKRAAKAELIEPAGFTKSTIPRGHRRNIQIWKPTGMHRQRRLI